MRERSPGVWQLRASAGFDANGDHRVVTRTHRGTKTTAAKALAELVATTHIPQSTGTVGELLDTWLQVAQISRTTRSVYEGALVHLPARWRQLRVDRVQSSDVARLYSALTAAGVGAQTVRKVHTVLSGAFSQAGRWGQIARNPCQGVKLPAVTSRSDAPTEEQITALLAAASLQERVWLTLAITSGVRRGEVVSLRWPAVDLDGARLTVATSTTVLGEVKSTKTARTDVIAIPDGLVVLLREWRRAQMERALACGVSYDTAGFVLSDDPTCSTGWSPNLATHRFGLDRIEPAEDHVLILAEEDGWHLWPICRPVECLGHGNPHRPAEARCARLERAPRRVRHSAALARSPNRHATPSPFGTHTFYQVIHNI